MPSVRRTAIRLADGRDFFYYDDSEPYVSGGKTRRLDDPRPLADRFAPIAGPDGEALPVTGPKMRLDPLTGEWIPMATHRMNRTFLPGPGSNPLAPADPNSEYSDGEIPDTDYDVVVFENRFPSLLQVPGEDPTETYVDDNPLWPTRPAAGRCEVICFSPEPTTSLANVSQQRMRTIVEAWTDRTRELSALEGIEQVYIFENRGEEIGVTLHHPHGQIYAYPYLTPRTSQMLVQARAHRERTGGNLLRDILDAELASGRRVVARTEHWAAYVPAAARWPVEVHIAPLRDVPDLPALSTAERESFADLYLRLLRRLERFYADDDGTALPLPYISGFHQAPIHEGRDDLRLHLQFFSLRRAPGKLKYLAGSESGMGAWISDTSPEQIADRLNEIEDDG